MLQILALFCLLLALAHCTADREKCLAAARSVIAKRRYSPLPPLIENIPLIGQAYEGSERENSGQWADEANNDALFNYRTMTLATDKDSAGDSVYVVLTESVDNVIRVAHAPKELNVTYVPSKDQYFAFCVCMKEMETRALYCGTEDTLGKYEVAQHEQNIRLELKSTWRRIKFDGEQGYDSLTFDVADGDAKVRVSVSHGRATDLSVVTSKEIFSAPESDVHYFVGTDFHVFLLEKSFLVYGTRTRFEPIRLSLGMTKYLRKIEKRTILADIGYEGPSGLRGESIELDDAKKERETLTFDKFESVESYTEYDGFELLSEQTIDDQAKANVTAKSLLELGDDHFMASMSFTVLTNFKCDRGESEIYRSPSVIACEQKGKKQIVLTDLRRKNAKRVLQNITPEKSRFYADKTYSFEAYGDVFVIRNSTFAQYPESMAMIHDNLLEHDNDELFVWITKDEGLSKLHAAKSIESNVVVRDVQCGCISRPPPLK